jgi:DNA polymerase III subunit epsilon
MTQQIDFFVAARASSIQWAKDILAIPADQLLILDTETTGLDNTAEIVQLSIIDGAGDVVINTFVHPTRPIPPEATAIHHITNQDVAVAPKWETVFTLLQKIVEGKTLVIYNKDYDLRLIKQSSIAAGISFPVIGCKDVQCAMQAYSEFVGEWNDYRGSFRWQKLKGGDHSALGDCRATLDLIHKMAAADHIEVADVTYPDWPQESAAPLATSTQAPTQESPAQTRVDSHEGNGGNADQHVYHHNVYTTKLNVKLEKNSKGYNWEVTVTEASSIDEALKVIRDTDAKLAAQYGQPAA